MRLRGKGCNFYNCLAKQTLVYLTKMCKRSDLILSP